MDNVIDYGQPRSFSVYPFTYPPSGGTSPLSPLWETKDSGKREVMETGSQRDSRVGKGRYDLLSPHALRRLAGVFERGSLKYEARNWEKGQPAMRYFDSAIRHLLSWQLRMTDEDHLAQAEWNIHALVHQDELKDDPRYAGLDDRP